MIQRKQTLFLLFAIVFIVGFLLTPAIKVYNPYLQEDMMGYDFKKFVNFSIIDGYFVYVNIIAECIAIGLLLLAIFLYKKRKAQIVVCAISIFPILFGPLYAYYFWAGRENIYDTAYYFGNINAFIAIGFVLAAWYFINKDEQLVKSMDRLR